MAGAVSIVGVFGSSCPSVDYGDRDGGVCVVACRGVEDGCSTLVVCCLEQFRAYGVSDQGPGSACHGAYSCGGTFFFWVKGPKSNVPAECSVSIGKSGRSLGCDGCFGKAGDI